jgi:hypothetical protein
MLRPLISAAKKLAARLPSFPADDLRDLLASLLHRVIIQENNIQVMITRIRLRELLENSEPIAASNFVGKRRSLDASE